MAITSSLGLGSGMDINSLVSQLVQAEGQPATSALDRQQKATQTHLSALGTLKSALSDFQTAIKKLKTSSAFQAQKPTSSNEALATVSSDTSALTGAVSGNYTLEVLSLAKSQKSITTAGFADLNAAVGEGTLTFTVGSKAPVSITVDTNNNSLAGIRDSINAANSGVTASILNVDNGAGGTVSKLMLSSTDPGSANSFTVSGTETGGTGAGLSQLFSAGLSTTAGSDAVIKVDGQIATRSTNSISDVVQGLTINLNSAPTAATPFNVNVVSDTKTITDNANGFVTAFNKLQSVMKDLGKYDPVTKKAGDLNGNSTLQDLQYNIREIAGSAVGSVTGSNNSLYTLGFDIDRNGVMSLDSSKFNKVMSTNLNDLSKVFTANDGIATRLDDSLTQVLKSGGNLDIETTSLNQKMTDISKKRDDVQVRLDSVQQRLLKQFLAMDSAVAKFKQASARLSKLYG